MSKIYKWETTNIYNQNLNTIPNDCSWFSFFEIIRLKYWIDVNYSIINSVLWLAIKAWILKNEWAVFKIIYQFNINIINKYLWIKLKIVEQDMLASNIYWLLFNNWFYWIWLIMWNSTYLNAIKKWYLSKEDIDNIKKTWIKWSHNNVYWYWCIYEIYNWTKIDCNLEILQYWIQQWVFWWTWRTITPANQFTDDIWKLLTKWKDNPEYDPFIEWKKSNYDISVMNKAWNILLKYEIKK